MQEIGALEGTPIAADILIVYFDPERSDDYLQLARQLRLSGLRVEMYVEPKKIGQQLKYANRRGHRLAVIAGSEELEQGVCQIKDLHTGVAEQVSLQGGYDTLVRALKQKLAD